jgi:flagellar motility protein MotE (MotC chaperone)
MPSLRLIPIVIFAAISLLAIKTLGFMGDLNQPAKAQQTLQTQIWHKLSGRIDADPIVTGATPEKKDSGQPAQAALPRDLPAANATANAAKGAAVPKGAAPPIDAQSGSERALLERLQERRQELEARARDLEMRESLLKAAEKQLDSRLGEVKDGEAGKGEASERVKALVVMYESMGPKEAARIFDRLDPRTLVELVNHMNPRKVSEIMAKMQPEVAERMTLELARGRGGKSLPASDLKRIDASTAKPAR